VRHDRLVKLASIGEWTFYRDDHHGFTGTEYAGKSLFTYAFRRDERQKTGELYTTIEHAMAAAIAEQFTGPRGAGGSGVGTAADWFMKMIGADLPTRSELIERAGKHPEVAGIAEDAGASGGGPVVAETVIDALGLELRS
jgi:hypothetical protein